MQPDLARVLYGTTEPVAPGRLLRAGPLSALLEQGNLRDLRWDGVEVLRGVACLVRDRDWGTHPVTIEGLFEQQSDVGFTVGYRASCGAGAATLDYEARIEARLHGAGAPRGARLSFSVRFLPRADFETNRAGFVVLHPLDGVAGAELEVEHVDGSRRTVTLPAAVSPHQPLFDLRALAHVPAPGLRVEVRMEGDRFEMEDQRNWTDASFKTYVRPLALPFPYTLAAGRPVEQAIQVEVVCAEVAGARTAPGRARDPAAAGPPPAPRLPALAVGLDPEALPLPPAVERALAQLAPAGAALPLVVRHDPQRGHGAGTLAQVAALARRLDARVQLEAVLPCRAPVAEELAALARALGETGLAPAALAVSPAADLKTGSPHDGPLPPLAEIYRAARAAFPGLPLGGGTFAYFTELNRKRPPAQLLDFVTYTTCPIVHAADDASVLQTLEALPWVFGSVRSEILAPAAGRAVAHHVGPVSIAMRDNPYGRAPADNPGGVRLAMAADDPRQRGLFGAAFYLAYAAAAARAGVDQLALCAPAGPRGLCAPGPSPDAPAALWPAYHVARALAAGAGARWVDLEARADEAARDGAPVAALAWERAGQRVALVANPAARPARVRLVLPGARGAVAAHVLDQRTCAAAAQDPGFLSRTGAADELRPDQGAVTLELGAFAVARLSWACDPG